MQFILFTLLAAMVAVGVQRMSRDGRRRNNVTNPKTSPKEVSSALEMIPCPVCHAYVIKDASGRADCPQHPPSPAA